MNEIGVTVAVGALVLFALVRGHTAKALGQMRHECGTLVGEERRLRQERDQEEILIESAAARRNQTQFEVQKFTEELEGLAAEEKQLKEQLPASAREE